MSLSVGFNTGKFGWIYILIIIGPDFVDDPGPIIVTSHSEICRNY